MSFKFKKKKKEQNGICSHDFEVVPAPKKVIEVNKTNKFAPQPKAVLLTAGLKGRQEATEQIKEAVMKEINNHIDGLGYIFADELKQNLNRLFEGEDAK